MKNKRGKVSPWIAFTLGILLIGGLGTVAWTVPSLHNATFGKIGLTVTGTPSTGAGTVTNQTGTGAGSISGTGTGTGVQPIVTTNPTISFTGQQAQNIGQTFSTGYRVSVNGGAFGSTTASGTGTLVPGQTAEFLINATGYHNAPVNLVNGVVQPLSIQSKTFPLSIQMNKNASLTQTFYYGYANANLGNMLASGYNATTAQNITNAGTNGASYTIKERLYGTAQASTQDMVCTVELSSGTNTTATNGVTMDGSGSGNSYISATPDPNYATTAPPWYTLKTSSSSDKVWTFDVTPITNTGEHDLTLTINSQASKSMPAGATVYQICHTKEWVVDSGTGLLTYEVGDSQTNAIQSLAQYSFETQFSA